MISLSPVVFLDKSSPWMGLQNPPVEKHFTKEYNDFTFLSRSYVAVSREQWYTYTFTALHISHIVSVHFVYILFAKCTLCYLQYNPSSNWVIHASYFLSPCPYLIQNSSWLARLFLRPIAFPFCVSRGGSWRLTREDPLYPISWRSTDCARVAACAMLVEVWWDYQLKKSSTFQAMWTLCPQLCSPLSAGSELAWFLHCHWLLYHYLCTCVSSG